MVWESDRFKARGLKGTRTEIHAACAPYRYHALALRLLAGVVQKNKRNPGDIKVARRYPVLPELKGKEKHHILQIVYDELDELKRLLLSRIAAFRSPMTYEALAIFMAPSPGQRRSGPRRRRGGPGDRRPLRVPPEAGRHP